MPGQLRNIVTSLHESTSRDYLSRMMDNKVHCMKIAKQYDKDYWDGDRRYGYGGYKYIPKRWKYVAQSIIDIYGLNEKSKVLDIGCGKGYLLYELKLLIPKINIVGIDLSNYALINSKKEIRHNLLKYKAQDNLPFKDNEFDLVVSLGVMHNIKLHELKNALFEMERIGKNGYLMVESYRNEKEFFNLQCWALTAESLFGVEEWIWLYKMFGYKGDYEFIYFT